MPHREDGHKVDYLWFSLQLEILQHITASVGLISSNDDGSILWHVLVVRYSHQMSPRQKQAIVVAKFV